MRFKLEICVESNAVVKRSMQRKVVLTMILAFIITLLSGYLLVLANSTKESNMQKQKYYSSMKLTSGDCLWDFAVAFADTDMISYNNYIKELKTINQLDSDTIYAGQYLTYFYYSEEIK